MVQAAAGPEPEPGVVAHRPGHDRVHVGELDGDVVGAGVGTDASEQPRRARRPTPRRRTSPSRQLMRSVPGPSGVSVARTNSCGASQVVGSALP